VILTKRGAAKGFGCDIDLGYQSAAVSPEEGLFQDTFYGRSYEVDG